MKNNNYLIYGINNCLSFLDSKINCSKSNIYINKDGLAFKNEALISKLNQEYKIAYLSKGDYLNKFNFKHDQGIVISFQADLYDNISSIEKIGETACFLICDQINDPQNLGQIVRTSECAGIDGIILPKHGSTHITESVIQVSQGALFNMNIFIETNLNNTIKYLKSKGFWVVGLENSIEAQNWHSIDYRGKIAIVVGSEGKGIRRLVRESCDFLATIPMNGKINSLNVTAAVSAILFERQRQIES